MKMFSFMLISILMVQSLAKASGVRVNPVPQEQLAVYKKAVQIALEGKDSSCDFSRKGYEINTSLIYVINSATAASVSDDGSQPILTFTESGAETQFLAKVTSSADYKSVVSVELTKFKLVQEEVNTGNLAKPVIVKKSSWKVEVNAKCVIINN